jgi:hypothetical protein
MVVAHGEAELRRGGSILNVFFVDGDAMLMMLYYFIFEQYAGIRW